MNINIKKFEEKIPKHVRNVADILNGNGYKAYLVGGSVRDFVLGKEPKDYDIATDALPAKVAILFPRCITTNVRFGTVLVIMDSAANGEKFDVEVTTFRKEADYYRGRWPSKVEFTNDLLGDLSRRDFTINAMAIDLSKISDPVSLNSELLIDPFGGIDDIEKKTIKAVGIAVERFTEDGLRAFKACRLSCELEFEIEEKTFKAIKTTLGIANIISTERIRDEFLKMLYHSIKPSIGIELMRKSGLLELFLPEILEEIGVTQPEFHKDDLYTHSLKVLDLAEDSIKLAGLFHDIGKIKTKKIGHNGRIHFYGHDIEGAQMTNKILKRLKLPKNEISKVTNLIRWHMFFYPSNQWRKEYGVENISKIEEKKGMLGGWSDSAIRRFIKNVGEEQIEDLFKLRIADAASNPMSVFDKNEITLLQKRISDVKASEMIIKISDLAIKGNDLKEIGIKSGPQMGMILKYLLEKVIDDPLMNTKEALTQEIKRYLSTLKL